MIQTYTGKLFNPLAGENEDCGPIELMDIAHALSHLCRFNGHTKRFYSVGEHSLHVSALLEHHGPSIQAWGLLHDAAEAYLGDMVRPIKKHMPDFQAIEDRLLQRIAKRFDLVWPIPDVVFDADDILLATEFRDLMQSPPQTPLRMQPIPPLPGWNAYLPPLAQTPFDTRQVFLYEAHRLGLK